MTVMINPLQDEQQTPGLPALPVRTASYWLPALATLILHAAMASLLLSDWEPTAVAAPAATTLQTRLVPLAQPEPPAEPVVEAPAPQVSKPEPELQQTPVPDEPPPVAEPAPQPEPDYAAIARKRVEERERERRAEQRLQEQRQAEQARLERQRAAEAKAEQQRLERERLAAEHAAAQRALQARQQATLEAEEAAAAQDVSQYLPISKQAPAYPRRALNQKMEGDCLVEYTVTAQGTVANPTVVEGACDPIFARPSIASASNFRYQPRIIDGKAVAVPGVRNTFRFRIEGQ